MAQEACPHLNEVVGCEPSGALSAFDEFNTLNLPYNALTTSGTINCTALLEPTKSVDMRFKRIAQVVQRMCGLDKPPQHTQSDYQQSLNSAHAHTALALGHILMSTRTFPHVETGQLHETLDLFHKVSSINLTIEDLGVLAGTLANGGVCPLTKERVFEADVVKNTLSLLISCGLGKQSGEFSFKVGMPAIGGMQGALMVVVPNVFGACFAGPGVNANGQPARAIKFMEAFGEVFTVHIHDRICANSKKTDPRLYAGNKVASNTFALLHAATKGDVSEIKKLHALGVDLNSADYDQRTAAHLAASENQAEVLRFFGARGVNLAPKDRWGNTPVMDAEREGNADALSMLRRYLEPSNDTKKGSEVMSL